MTKKATLGIVGSVLFVMAIVGLVALAFSDVYFVREGSGGTLFCKADEAYLFMGGGGYGYHLSYVKYPWMLLGEYLNAPPLPTDARFSSIVIRVTPSTVERHVADFGDEAGNSPVFITPFEDGFYAQCPGVVLCKWTGSGFNPATQEEQRKHDGTDRLFQGGTANGLVNQWSIYHVGFSPGDHFEVQVGNKFVIVAKNQAVDVREYSNVSVRLLRPGQPPENLYNVNGTPRIISKTEYERFFPKRK